MLRNLLKQLYFILYKFIHFPFNVKVEGDPRKIKIGKKCHFGTDVTLSVKGGGKLTIGDNCYILKGVIISTYGGDIKIGNECSFNPYTIIYGHGGLIIKDFVRIATHSVIIPANHKYDLIDVPITKQGLSKKGILINEDVWIGANVTVLDGSRIGVGAVIAAGAVVRNELQPYSVYGGVPAKLIGKRGIGLQQ